MESFRYHDLGRIAYADALEYQTAAFEVLLDAKATGKKEDNQLFLCEHLPVLTIGKSGKDSNLLIPEETDDRLFQHMDVLFQSQIPIFQIKYRITGNLSRYRKG